jgi:putative transposase
VTWDREHVSLLLFVALGHCFRTAAIVLLDLCRFVRLAAYSRSAVAAENLFLQKQLELFRERTVKPHRADDPTRWLMASVKPQVRQ